jgi:hypothetical protein
MLSTKSNLPAGEYRTAAATKLIQRYTQPDLDELVRLAKRTTMDLQIGITSRGNGPMGVIIASGEDFSLNLQKPDREFFNLVGKMLTAAGMPHLCFGVATWADQPYPEHANGWWFRVMPDGSNTYADVVWPGEKPVDPRQAGK